MSDVTTAARASGSGDERIVIRTSEPGWIQRLAVEYKNRASVTIVDDAKVGINPEVQTIFQMGRKARVPGREWTGVLIALGMSAAGAAMVIAALLDPEPTSKLWLLVASGAVILAGGGWGAIQILTKIKPPRVKIGRDGIEIDWG